MNNYKNKILVLLLITLSTVVHAQVYLGASTGVYSLDSNYKNVSAFSDFNINLKAGYVKTFKNNFGIGVGLEYAQLKSNVNTDEIFSTSTNLIDDVNSAFVYKVTTEGYSEDQEFGALQIPLFLQYKTRLDSISSFYVRVGAKYFMPRNFKTKATASKVTATGYYPDFNLLITDLPSHGFGTTLNYSESAEYETQNVFMFNLELGVSFNVGTKNSIYAGFFVERATQSIIKSVDDVSFIGYNPNSVTNRKLNGIYNSKKDGEVIPFNYGLTVYYSFGR
jgi:hypothetical protein